MFKVLEFNIHILFTFFYLDSYINYLEKKLENKEKQK